MSANLVGESFVHVEDLDGDPAADKLFEEAMEDGGLEKVDQAFLFCSVNFDLDAVVGRLNHLVEEHGGELVGGTTGGEISKEGSSNGGAVLLLIQSDDIEFENVKEEDVWENPKEKGEKAAEQLANTHFQEDEDKNNAVIALPPGFNSNRPAVEFKVLQGMSKVIGSDIPVAGGSTGDDLALGENFQFYDGEVYSRTLILTGIKTSHEIVTGQEHGMRNKIKTGLITESEENIIKKISGQPAAEFYVDALEDDVTVDDLRETFESETGAQLQKVFQYALRKTLGEELSPTNTRAVTPVQVLKDGSLYTTAAIGENNAIHVIEGEREDIVDAAKKSFPELEDDIRPLFGIVSDCAIRSASMSQEERDSEVMQLRDRFEAPMIGFYGYGEIGGKNNYCTFNNQTVSGLMIAEKQN